MRGISLIETLIAGLVFSVTFFVIISLYPAGLLGMRQGQQWVGATNLAQSLLEQRRASYASLADEAGDQTVDGIAYHYKIQVGPSPDGTAEVKRVLVTVSWKDGQVDRQTSLETRLFHWRSL
jgi:Tfp pilus assembly protein PilV